MPLHQLTLQAAPQMCIRPVWLHHLHHFILPHHLPHRGHTGAHSAALPHPADSSDDPLPCRHHP